MKQQLPILIYQMGKVGSASIKASLDALNVPTRHVHFLSWSGIEEVEEYYNTLSHLGVPEHLTESRQLRTFIDQTWGQVKWKVITLVREPIARDISNLFQNLADHLPYINGMNESQASLEVGRYLHRSFRDFDESTDYVCTWFDREIKDVFGIDVYATPFDTAAGYQIYSGETVDVLLLKLEMLSDCYQVAFQEFLGLRNFQLVDTNIGHQKAYASLYNRTLKNFKLPDPVLNRIYASRHARHFYTQGEIAQFKQKWLQPAHPTRVTAEQKKIIVIHPEGNLNNNPNLTGLVEILCEQGYQVHYYAPLNNGGPAQPPCPGAKVFLIEDGRFDLQDRYDLVIGVDRGIIPAAQVARDLGAPCGFISYELFFADEAGIDYKRPEIEACQNIAFAVSQDKVRAGLLARENRIASEKIITIPVAGRGVFSGGPTTLLHEKLNLTGDKKIALYMGSINSPWTMIDQLLSSTAIWDDNWVLVLHHRYGNTHDALIELRRQYPEAKNVYFSPFQNLPFQDLHKLIQAANLGIALYQPQHTDRYNGKNLAYMGLSSGKIATYLQHGVPVLTNEIGQMADYVRQAQLGVVIREVADIPQALNQFSKSPPIFYRENCFKFFARTMDLTVTIQPLLEQISALLRSGKSSPVDSAEHRLFRATALPTVVSNQLPKITIVTPSFNQAQFLEACIDSILSQNYPNLEYIIMDGGSTDGSVEIIKKYQKYLAYWQSRPDGGHYRAVNDGFKRSTGAIMGWLNSDDKLHPQALFKVAYVFSMSNTIEWITGRVTKWDQAGNLALKATVRTWSRQDYLEGRYQWIQQESTFWKRTLWERAGGYLDTTFELAGDLALWARFFRYAQLHSVDDLLGGYRVHGNQRGQRFMDRYLAEAEQIIIGEIKSYQASADKMLLPAPPVIKIEPYQLNQYSNSVINRPMRDPSQEHPEVPAARVDKHLVSAIISTYNAERFMRGRLQNLVEQTLYRRGQLEIIVIDSNSPQNEGDIVREFAAQYPHITYQRTAQRETVYAAWNRAIGLARGRYIINANTDDRFAPDALERLVAALEADSTLDATYGDWLVTQVENDTIDSPSDKFVFHYPEFFPPLFLYYHITGHSAMLRRSVFERIGPYDGSFKVLGDRDLMLRFAAAGLRAQKIPGLVGLYLENAGSLERTGGTFHQELAAIRQQFLETANFARLFGHVSQPDNRQLAQLYAAAGALGKNFYQWRGQPTSDFVLAAQLCFKAIELDPANSQALNNLAVIACVENQHGEGRRILGDALKAAPTDIRPALAANLALAERGETRLEAYHWMTSSQPEPGGCPPGFSFCIISGGQRPHKLAQLIESIHAQNIDNYEIIVAGSGVERPDTIYLPLPEQAQTGQTSVLRNAAAARSQYSHIVFSDDDILLQPGWFTGVQPYTNEYDMLATTLLNMDGTRHWDWAAISPANEQRMLDYGATDADLYLTSGLLLVKRQVWETIRWDERLGFYQQEDVDFSKRALRAGFAVKFCSDSVALHNDYRYTQIGRGVWQRSEAGIAAWLDQSLLRLTPAQLTEQAVAHVNGQRLGDAADCLRVSLRLDPNYHPARDLWNELVRALGGATDEGDWSPQPLVAAPPQSQKSTEIQPPTPIYWEGSQFVNHSMALINREFCLRLAETPGVELSVIPYEADQFDPAADPRFAPLTQRLRQPLSGPARVHIRHQWPPNFIPPADGHWVMIQPWEFGSLPKQWIEIMRAQVDEVWAYTHYVRDCYIRSGMPADRVHVVSPGVDVEQFRPEAPPLPLQTQKRFKFLFVGGTIERKGIDILLEVYTQTFSAADDVCLVVKDMGGGSFYKGQTARQIIAQIQADANAPAIEYIDRFLGDDELAGLYTACDCLVHPYRGEGFALPIAEAMASGLPVIVTGHGAALDFCRDERAYLIPAEEVRMSNIKRTVSHETIDYPWWANPDRQALAHLMRHVLAHSAEARAKGQAALDFIRRNFTWDRGVKMAAQRIEAVQQRPIVRFAQRPSPPETLLVLSAPDQSRLQQLGDCLRHLEQFQPQPVGRLAVRLVKPKEISLDLQYNLQVEEAAEADLFPALSAALKYSQATYVVVLSYGVTVTTGWLETMIAVAESDPAIAAVGPVSNRGPGPQQISAAYRPDEQELQKFAAEMFRQHRSKWVQVSHLGGFCLLLKREMVLAAGGLTNAPDGTLEDLLARLQARQLKLACAQGVFVEQRAEIAPLPPSPQRVEAQPAVPTMSAQLEQAQQAGNWPEAISLLHQMIGHTQETGAAGLWNQLGYCYVQNGQPFEAEMAFERGLELDAENLDLLANLADLYLGQERYQQASDYLNRALRLDPDDVPLLLSLGDCAIRLGALDAALMAFERVRTLAPETEGIDVVLRELAAVRQ